MTFELVIFLVFLFYHLSVIIGLGGAINYIGRFSNWQPTANESYRLWLTVFLLAIAYPIIQAYWHAQGLSEAMAVSTVSSSYEQFLPLENAQQSIQQAASASIESGQGGSSSLSLVSNSSDSFYIADQLAYILIPFMEALAVVLLAGIALRVLKTFGLLVKTAWLIRSSRKVQLPPLLRRSIFLPVLSTDKITVPMAAGVFHPVIILPTRLLDELSEEQLHHVLLHEQAHHQRRDLWVSVLLRLVTAVYWWSPALRPVNKKIKLYREMICDELAANKAGDSLCYAQSLLDCAKLSVASRPAYLGVELVGSGSDLSKRISGLINFDRPRHSLCLLLLILASFSLITGALLSQVSLQLVGNDKLVRTAREHQLQEPQQAQVLVAAINQEDKAKLERLVSGGVNLNIPSGLHGTALMIAVKNDSVAMVSELLRLGADPNQAAIRWGNPLIVAAYLGNERIAALLLEAGADINAIVPRDETPLMNAAFNGQLAMVQFLVEEGAQVNLGVRASVFDGLEYRTPLSRASSQQVKSYLHGAGAI